MGGGAAPHAMRRPGQGLVPERQLQALIADRAPQAQRPRVPGPLTRVVAVGQGRVVAVIGSVLLLA
jgi:hypothetical protein